MNKNHEIKIYMIEDRMSLSRCYAEFLRHEDPEVVVLNSGQLAMDFVSQHAEPHLFLLDLQIKDKDGFELLEYIREKSPDSAVVVITSNGSYEISRKVMSAGATDYLEKPFTRDRLCVTMRNAQKQLELQQVASPFSHGFCGFIGNSLIMQSVYRMIESAAASDKASVFVTGESGTGKEVCSHAIHDLSGRRDNECIILNCAAIPKDLMESEIFGHVKGAFTGAVSHRDGAATRAHQGTLFLDEIGEMDMELQSKLLRFIQSGQFCKVGSSKTEVVDVRFVCATNRDPLVEIAQGRFREDLYYRLNVIPIDLPPLREREKDIINIAEHYLGQFAKEEGKEFTHLSEEVEQIFLAYSWPGNVRQLLNILRNIVVLNSGTIVLKEMLPAPFNQHALQEFENSKKNHSVPRGETLADSSSIENSAAHVRTHQARDIDDVKPLWQVEMEAIDRAVELCGGNVSKAAKLLEISPSTIYRKKPNWRKGNDNWPRDDAASGGPASTS